MCLHVYLEIVGHLKVISVLSHGRYFPYGDENNHKLVREIGNVTNGLELTVQFAVKPEFMNGKVFAAKCH